MCCGKACSSVFAVFSHFTCILRYRGIKVFNDSKAQTKFILVSVALSVLQSCFPFVAVADLSVKQSYGKYLINILIASCKNLPFQQLNIITHAYNCGLPATFQRRLRIDKAALHYSRYFSP